MGSLLLLNYSFLSFPRWFCIDILYDMVVVQGLMYWNGILGSALLTVLKMIKCILNVQDS
jgi:hypothetical protein